MNRSISARTRGLAVIGIFTAILAIQNFVGFLGYIQVVPGVLEFTIIQITVIVAALCLGWRGWFAVGAVWGALCLLRAWAAPTSPLDILLFRNPLVSVLPRVFVGAAGAGVYVWLKRLKAPKAVALAAGGVVGSVVNTALVLGAIYAVHRGRLAEALDLGDVVPWLMGIVTFNGIPEAVVSGLAVAAIGLPLTNYLARRESI